MTESWSEFERALLSPSPSPKPSLWQRLRGLLPKHKRSFKKGVWIPIEEAPKDGTGILLAHITYDGMVSMAEEGYWCWIENSDWDGRPIYDWATSGGHLEEPNYFMVLPEAPECVR